MYHGLTAVNKHFDECQNIALKGTSSFLFIVHNNVLVSFDAV